MKPGDILNLTPKLSTIPVTSWEIDVSHEMSQKFQDHLVDRMLRVRDNLFRMGVTMYGQYRHVIDIPPSCYQVDWVDTGIDTIRTFSGICIPIDQRSITLPTRVPVWAKPNEKRIAKYLAAKGWRRRPATAHYSFIVSSVV